MSAGKGHATRPFSWAKWDASPLWRKLPKLADCDCEPEDDSPLEVYSCAACGADVKVCLGCYVIRHGCDCGECEDGDGLEG